MLFSTSWHSIGSNIVGVVLGCVEFGRHIKLLMGDTNGKRVGASVESKL